MENSQNDQFIKIKWKERTKRRCLSEDQKKMLFDDVDLVQFEIESFRNSPFFKCLSFNQLFKILQKWNLFVKYSSNKPDSNVVIKKDKYVVSKIYQQLQSIKNKSLHQVQSHLSKFIKLPLIERIINPQNYYPTIYPTKKLNTNLSQPKQHFWQKKSSTKTKHLLNYLNKEQAQRLHNSIQKKQIEKTISKILQNKSRMACHRMKMRKYEPINKLSLHYGECKYKIEKKKKMV